MEPCIPEILSGVRGSGAVTHIRDKALSGIRGLVCTGRPVYGTDCTIVCIAYVKIRCLATSQLWL